MLRGRRGIGGIRDHWGLLGVLGAVRRVSGGVGVSEVYWGWQGV